MIEALDIEKAGNWTNAHSIVQKIDSVDACRVYAYLHRKEGDLNNARYWYSIAETKMPDNTLDEEWAEIRGSIK